MARFTSSTINSLYEVLVKVKDDAPNCPSQMKRKCGPEKDYAWFLEDDFNIDCFNEETSYLKVGRLLGITQWASLLLLLAFLICTLSISELKVLDIWDVAIWKWELLILAIICGQLIAGLVVEIVVLLAESSFHLRIGFLYVVYGIKQSVQNVVWLSLVMIASHFIVEGKDRVPNILRKVMLCLLVGTFMWLLKTIIVKVLASSFHLISFFRRIRVSLYKQYVIKKLGGDLVKGRNQEDMCREVSRQVLGAKKVTAFKVKRMIEIVQAGDLPCLSTVDEDLPIRSDEEDEDECSLRAKYEEVKQLARNIFSKVAQQSQSITVEDLKNRLGDDKVTKPQELFAGSMCKAEITEDGFIHWMMDAYTERRRLALSVNDTKTAVDDLHRMMDAIVAIMILVTWLIMCGVPITQFLIFATTQLALAVYVFGNTAKTVLESIIFLFILHPYDVGDRCEVDGTQMIVDEMTILSTVFMRRDNQKIIYPNSILANKSIGNYSRSPAMGDEIEFSVDISTPWKKIEEMKKEIKEYLSKKSDYWFDDAVIVAKGMENMNRLNMVLWPKHVVNHHDMTQRWERRSQLIVEMIKVFRELGIVCKLPPLDVNVNNTGSVISDMPPYT
uniref:mechanosensitive ion channel protein 6-like n=1 Tax=Erigeron canadensis TaxID=72917 RepID=UPI001CB96F12|nr:mechanosensitive ion channel protein 6-like [Erigeron canadensis]